MMTLGTLKLILERSNLPDDTPVAVAVQPSYPLAHDMHGVFEATSQREDSQGKPILFIVADGGESLDYGNPYGPHDAWEWAETDA